MHDGREVVGTIRGVSDKGLEMDFGYGGYGTAYTLSTKGKKGKKPSKSAKTSAFGPYGYGGYGGYGGGYGYGWGRNVIAWEAIALLFLIPFLFI
ncbi:hypothetical protein JCM10914_1082 [Paenibacillus sp. JCM 10914]|nr:hypothetical protein JCM10914_1082 [Paenibacillus sp. JCM 10914]